MKEPINPRQFALDVIAALPENASNEKVREELEILSGILESIRDEELGRMYTHEQVMAELKEWISASTGRREPAAT